LIYVPISEQDDFMSKLNQDVHNDFVDSVMNNLFGIKPNGWPPKTESTNPDPAVHIGVVKGTDIPVQYREIDEEVTKDE